MDHVCPGQIWQDMDPREVGRFLLVERIDGDKAVCSRIADCDGRWVRMNFRNTRISVGRMKPGSNGYWHVGSVVL